jgi:tRNA (cmo5U34)-methyltransferase
MKSTVAEIRERFDNDVERFSNLETGQSATMDAPLVLELIAGGAAAINPDAKDLFDIGCGAGNYTLKLLQYLPNCNSTLNDLSLPMLERAKQRVSAATTGTVTTIQDDIREIELGEGVFDVITAAMVLHHLREEQEWHDVFAKLYKALRPGGTLWIADHITHADPRLDALFQSRWGTYLTALKNEEYRDTVFAYVAKEDTPRPLLFQIDAQRKAGFSHVEVLHKNTVFAAWVAIK